MTKISNQVVYIPDTEINGLDYLIGTDYDNAKKTVNFRVEDLGSHFNMVNGIRNFDYVFYQHQGVNPTPTDGYFYSNGNTQVPEDIEYFIFPKKTYRGKDSSQFFLSIATENPFDLIIAQKIDNNTVFFFRIDSIETFTNYFKLNVSEVFFPDGKSLDYVLSYAVFNLKSEGGPSITKTSDLINDGSDGTSTYVEADELGAVATSNDYNDLDNLPTIPTVPNFADQTETNDGLVVDKTIAPNTLAGWWTYVKGLAQIFSERITFGKEIKLTPITTPTYEKGLVYFDDTNDCISFLDSISGTSVQVGYEVLMRARNNTGTTILNGSVVYISGAIGQNSTIALAQANTLNTSEIIGIATHDIPNNTVGKICVFGLVNDLNTNSFTDGQMLYLSASVAGGLISSIPASPNFVVALGVVEHAHPTQGKILVRPQRALANNNSLGTAQNVPPTQNSVKTYVDTKPTKRTMYLYFPIFQNVAASTSWYALPSTGQIFTGTGYTANASLTDANDFADLSYLTSRLFVPFQHKVKSVSIHGSSNTTAANPVQFAVVTSYVSTANSGAITIPNPLIVAQEGITIYQSGSANGFQKKFDDVNLDTSTLNAGTDYRILFKNANEASNIQRAMLIVEVEEVL